MSAPSAARVQFRMRVYRGDDIAVGPGKIALLEAIERTRSISAAARASSASYRRAWQLIDALNKSLHTPAVETAVGGAHGGGSVVTDAGRELIHRYRAVEAAAEAAAADEIRAITRMLAS